MFIPSHPVVYASSFNSKNKSNNKTKSPHKTKTSTRWWFKTTRKPKNN